MMKTNIFRLSFAIAISTLLFVGCQKDNLLEGTDYNTLITVKGTSAKTSYNSSNGQVSWTQGDKISVVRGNSSTDNPFAEFTLLDVADNGTATFGGTIPDNAPVADYVAVYPCQSGLVHNARKVTLTAIRTTQTLKQGSFGEGDNTALGFNPTTTMQFRNIGGLAKIAVCGNVPIKSIRITSNVSGQKLSGRGTVNLNSDDLAITWDDASSYNYVEAVAPNQTSGFDVSEGNTFYIVLPSCTLSNYTVTITNINNVSRSRIFTSSVTISRATVTKLGAFDADGFAPSFSSYAVPSDEVWYRTTSGNPWNLNVGSEWCGHTVVSNTYTNGIGKIVLDGTLTSLGVFAISDNSDVTELYFSSSFTTFDSRHVISDMDNLACLEMPGVTTIPHLGLSSLDGLRQIVIPASLGSFEDGFITDANNLTCVRFIKSDAVYSLPSNLESAIVYYNSAVNSSDPDDIALAKNIVDEYAPFVNCPISIIYVPSTLLSAYQNDPIWASYMDYLGATFVGVSD